MLAIKLFKNKFLGLITPSLSIRAAHVHLFDHLHKSNSHTNLAVVTLCGKLHFKTLRKNQKKARKKTSSSVQRCMCGQSNRCNSHSRWLAAWKKYVSDSEVWNLRLLSFSEAGVSHKRQMQFAVVFIESESQCNLNQTKPNQNKFITIDNRLYNNNDCHFACYNDRLPRQSNRSKCSALKWFSAKWTTNFGSVDSRQYLYASIANIWIFQSNVY